MGCVKKLKYFIVYGENCIKNVRVGVWNKKKCYTKLIFPYIIIFFFMFKAFPFINIYSIFYKSQSILNLTPFKLNH